MKKRIKLFEPISDKKEQRAVQKVLSSGFWASGAGVGNVLRFENRFKKFVGARSCVAVNSGTAALHLALSLADIKGKEVILPSLSFISTAHAVLYNGGKPIFVDVNHDTLCMDPDAVTEKISDKTQLILPVHFAGMPANLSKLMRIAKEHNCLLIEDAAHACGATLQKKMIGSHGDFVCFSFHPVKNLAMPTGGLISINHSKHKKMKEILNARRWCGITNRKEVSYNIKELGWNYYMNEFSAAIGLVQLSKLKRLNRLRKKISKRYYDEISVDIKMPYNENCAYHFYWILIKNRDAFRKKMNENGIETGIHYKPIHTMTMYQNGTNLPITEKAGKQIVSIPTHPNLSDADVDRIVSTVNAFAKG